MSSCSSPAAPRNQVTTPKPYERRPNRSRRAYPDSAGSLNDVADRIDARTVIFSRSEVTKITHGATELLAQANEMREAYPDLENKATELSDAGPADAETLRSQVRAIRAAIALRKKDAEKIAETLKEIAARLDTDGSQHAQSVRDVVEQLTLPIDETQIRELTVNADKLQAEWEAELQAATAAADKKWAASVELMLQARGWKTFWLVPALGAGVVMLLFLALFRDDTPADKKGVSEGEVASAAAVEEMP